MKRLYSGCFINLDRNVRRRELLEQNLKLVGAADRYQRVAAVDGKAVQGQYRTELRPGSLGLWLTHEHILETHDPGGGHLHILEDDALLGRDAVNSIEKLLRHLDRNHPDWDMLFTETFVSFDAFRIYADLMKRFNETKAHVCLDVTSLYQACLSATIINVRSIPRYLELIKGKWALAIPYDMYVRKFIRERELKAYVSVPFITTISPESDRSDIRGDLDRSHRVYDVFRRGFFQDADRESLIREMDELIGDVEIPDLATLYLKGLHFYCSDKWVRF